MQYADGAISRAANTPSADLQHGESATARCGTARLRDMAGTRVNAPADGMVSRILNIAQRERDQSWGDSLA